MPVGGQYIYPVHIEAPPKTRVAVPIMHVLAWKYTIHMNIMNLGRDSDMGHEHERDKMNTKIQGAQ